MIMVVLLSVFLDPLDPQFSIRQIVHAFVIVYAFVIV